MSPTGTVKVSMVRVRLNAQGYHKGMYFGTGAPLYAVESMDTGHWFHSYVRGKTRDKAKEAARREFPHYELRFTR